MKQLSKLKEISKNDWKLNRLKKLFRHSDKLFIVPMDHGMTLGPVPGLEDIDQTVKAVFKGGQMQSLFIKDWSYI